MIKVISEVRFTHESTLRLLKVISEEARFTHESTSLRLFQK